MINNNKKIQVIVPMAGKGERFRAAGFTDPKPFINVLGSPMIELVLKNLYFEGVTFYLLARIEHVKEFKSSFEDLSSRYPITVVPVDHDTEGALCSVLLARRHLDSVTPLVIANSDQVVDFVFEDYIEDANQRGIDGSILVFDEETRHPKWSYASVDTEGFVTETKEKAAISPYATVGIYYFKNPQILFDAAIDLIALNDRTNNEFYVCPVYNYVIRNGYKVGIFEVPKNSMHGLGTPEDLGAYLKIQNRKA